MVQMRLVKQIGVFMDHAGAHLLTPEMGSDNQERFRTQYHLKKNGDEMPGQQQVEHTQSGSELHRHNHEQNELHGFYKNLASRIHDYDEILVMGPTTAAKEFYNYCRNHKLLNGKLITVRKSDYLTERQMEKEVNSFFAKLQQS